MTDMSTLAPLGITRIDSLHYYVHDLARSRRFYTEMLDFAEVARSTDEMESSGRQRSALFRAGDCAILCSAPIGEGGRAWRYLRKHPDGVGAIVFEVEDIERCFRLLEERGGTPIDEIQRHEDDGGTFATFSITTPFGDTTFRFLERRGYRAFAPGIVPIAVPEPGAGGSAGSSAGNALGFRAFDHVTSNFQTMKPTLLWLEHVMGFERYWEIEFHTSDVAEQEGKGSGLRSAVMWEPRSGVKFANNEPYRPYFKQSQINVFVEDHRGDGVQHAALSVGDIVAAVRALRARGVSFMPTPAAYYDMLPERLARLGVGAIDEPIATLRELGILVDGARDKSYLLQIFLEESADLYGDPAAGPFFFEIIQRKGDPGFGAGNFRALFESIERQQEKG